MASAVTVGAGAAIAAADFDTDDPWFYVGLATTVLGMTMLNTTVAFGQRRSLEHEFDIGYRIGYRAGRRAPRLHATKSRKVVDLRAVAGERWQTHPR